MGEDGRSGTRSGFPGAGRQGGGREIAGTGISRRQALTVIGGVAAGTALVPGSALAATPSRPRGAGSLGGGLRLALPASSPDLAFPVIRVEDMLYLGFEFYNAKLLVVGGQTRVVTADQKKPAFMVVVFPPQHHGEESDQYNVDIGYPLPPRRDALSGPSWLAFELPAHASIPLTAAALLAWSGLEPQLVPVVGDPKSGAPAAPDPLHSALEVPWSLWLSPPVGGTWHHAARPGHGGRKDRAVAYQARRRRGRAADRDAGHQGVLVADVRRGGGCRRPVADVAVPGSAQ